MEKAGLVKNLAPAQALDLAGLVEYQPGQVVSRTFAQNAALSFTLFAFDKGEGISAHTVAADAVVQVLEGSARVTIGGEVITVRAGQVALMPQGISHALDADERFKMLLFVIKQPQELSL